MRVFMLLLVAVVITATYASSFLRNEEYITVQERKQAMDEAVEEAVAAVKVKQLAKKNRVITQNEKYGKYTSSQLLAKFFKKPSEDAKKMGKAHFLYSTIVNKAEKKMLQIKRAKVAKTQGIEARTESLAEMLFHRPGSILTSEEVTSAWLVAQNMNLENRSLPTCKFPTVYLYRTINGTCNNLRNPLFGSSGIAFKRLVPASYEDGISSLRGTLQAQKKLSSLSPFLPPHPSVRFISETVVVNVTQDEIPFTHLMMQFGQFLDHDLDLGPEQEEECEGCDFSEICQPIQVPNLDRSFGVGTRNNGSCLPFRRSIPVFSTVPPQAFTPLEQVNDVTSFIDGSMIYGSRLEQSLLLRSLKGGLLLEGPNIPMNKPSLPIDTMNQVACPNHMDCFLCGDVRCNEQVSLSIMHTIWLREHNRCARSMAMINQHWDDERLYQTCRKIVGALIQKIAYEDYLPKILGKSFETFIGPYTGYNVILDPSIPNSFATAAYRYGHSLVRSFFDRLNDVYEPLPIGPLNLVDAFFSPDQFNTSLGTDPIMRGWVSVNAHRMDEFMNSVLTTQLFQTQASQGLDLASLNLQRGRDHGLAPYIIYRNFCFKKFGITSEIENDLTLVRFLTLYGSLEMAEVWLTGLAENRLNDGLLGATFACIFGLTFKGVREGDRFFWLNPSVFTPQQRRSINSDSISRVICNNSDGITSIQPDGFLSNQTRVLCSQLGRVDLNLFKEQVCYLRAKMNSRRFAAEISVFSRSTQPQFDYSNRKISANPSDVFTCIPIQCPTELAATKIFVFSSVQLLRRTAIYPNQLLPPNEDVLQNAYGALLPLSNFDNSSGLFMNNRCENSSDEVSFSFDIVPLEDITNEVNTDLPDEILAELGSSNPNVGLESVKRVNSDLFGKAMEKKQEEMKKMASLYSELEDALKKMN